MAEFRILDLGFWIESLRSHRHKSHRPVQRATTAQARLRRVHLSKADARGPGGRGSCQFSTISPKPVIAERRIVKCENCCRRGSAALASMLSCGDATYSFSSESDFASAARPA